MVLGDDGPRVVLAVQCQDQGNMIAVERMKTMIAQICKEVTRVMHTRSEGRQ